MLIKGKFTSNCKRTIGLYYLSLFYLLLLFNRIDGQQIGSSGAALAPFVLSTPPPATTGEIVNKTQSEIVTTTTTTTKPEAFNASEITLLSGDEFVDDKEVPTVLFDSLSNETSLANEKANTSQPTTTNPEDTLETTTLGNPKTSDAETVVTIPAKNETKPNEPSEEAVEDGNSEDEDETDTTTSGHDGSSKEAGSSTFEPPQNVSQYMDYIEKLFHDLRHQITDLFEPHIPQLIRTSQMVELSSSCSYDMLRLALALRQFEPWALRMIDSSGKVPEGIFEGSFTALGSYDECLNTVFQSSSPHMMSSASQSTSNNGDSNHQTASDRQAPTQGKYCLVTLSPFMPPKPPADKVERMFQDEANRRNYTNDDQFSRLSPMFYYMKFRIGVCIPSTCHQGDMDSISGALSTNLRLNITIPDCRVKQTKVPLTGAQFTGGLVFASVLAAVICATIFDYFKMRWHKMERQEIRLRDQLANGQYVSSTHEFDPSSKSNQFKIRIQAHQQQQQQQEIAKSLTSSRFEQQLERHWSWMSFSLLTNFRLYFQGSSSSSNTSPRSKTCQFEHSEQQQQKPNGAKIVCKEHEPQAISGHINCLDGIRVLSLCWVIVANSYLTLDPRATKRLSKSREAPRDFMFQLVVQASLAIETFFFLSGLLMSLSFARKLQPSTTPGNAKSWSTLADWLRFYLHRYIRMTPPTMLVIAFSMYAYHLGDGPLWFEATQRVHQSCAQNWWRHLLHVANFIDTRQMCFIHYWYISADMQLFLVAPIVMFLLYRCRHLGYALVALIGSISIGLVFYITYDRNLPPTLLFYNTDPESRREFGNTIMTKPFTHALPYLVGMLVGWCLVNSKSSNRNKSDTIEQPATRPAIRATLGTGISLTGLGGLIVACIALAELFLPYKWNNSHLPSKLMASIYAALFRFGWSLVLAYTVISCRHQRGRRCAPSVRHSTAEMNDKLQEPCISQAPTNAYCFCTSGGNKLNYLLSLSIFNHLSKLSFVAYLIHLPLMSVFIGQTRGLFAFSHTLVIHFAISYLVMTFILAFVLVHIIEFPFLTLERLMFDKLLGRRWRQQESEHSSSSGFAMPPTSDKYSSASTPGGIGENRRSLTKLKAGNEANKMCKCHSSGPARSNDGRASTNHNHNRRAAGDLSERL